MSDFKMVRGATVAVDSIRNTKNIHTARIVVDGQYVHQFGANSRISKALSIMTPTDLAERLTGGNFFFINDRLIDFRDNQHTGFVHTDESIEKLMEVIGVTEKKYGRNRSTAGENTMGNISLSNVWSEAEIEVPLYQEGGQFTSQLRFAWNPFMKDVRSMFDLVRMICTNGMVGMTSFLNTKIPLVNRWEEHLEIASRQIQNKVSNKVISRLGEMGTERATVADCQLIVEHADNRLADGNMSQGTRERLKSIGTIASPVVHLGKLYRGNVFNDRRLGAQLPAHLSTFDVYNMATEISSHTPETSKSSNVALDKFANTLVFDREDLTKHAVRLGAPSLSSFSDPEAAFFGEMK